MTNRNTSRYVILLILFLVSSSFVLSFPYPLRNDLGMWNGGTIPDEHAYFGWAWIYYKTGKTYVPLEEIGPRKVQHLDFYIGDSPEDCVFAKVEINMQSQDTSSPAGPQSKWEIRQRIITVTVYNGYNTGIPGVHVEVREKRGQQWVGYTDNAGKFTVEMPPGFYTVTVYTKNRPLKLTFATDFPNLNYPIIATATLKNWSGSAEVNIHVDHYINKNLNGVKIYLGFDRKKGEPVGVTGKNGDFLLVVPAQRMYHVVAVKETENIIPPVGSVVVKVDGKYAIANRWPPGYSYLIIPYWLSGLIHLINIFNCFVASASVYVITKRLYNEKTAFFATFLVIASGVGMMMIYSRGMADYASMAFSTAGIALFVESLYGDNRIFRSFVGFLGGLSFASAVVIRYSTVAVILGPFIYLLIRFVKYRSEALKKDSLPVFAFILGLLIVGSMLALYNTTLFGSPLNSGYQMSHRIEAVNGNVTIKTPERTMFEEFFHPSWNSVQNAFNRILPQLFLLLPPLFIAPLGLLLDFRRDRAWLLFFWALPILLIYMQLTYVGQIPYEEMRYFLPVLPPAAILSAHAINHLQKWSGGHIFAIILLILLLIIGFMMAYCAIFWQLHRHELGRVFDPPSIAYVIAGSIYLLAYGKVFMKEPRRFP